MSKFFDGTQRAAGVEIDSDSDFPGRSKRPKLRKAPLETVGVNSGEDLVSGEVRQDDVLLGPSDTLVIDTDAEENVAEIANEESYPEIEFDDEEAARGAQPAPTVVKAKSDLIEEPLHPAYDRIIQRLLAFRSTPRQSVVLFASAVPGEGASTIARNTAISLGRHRTERILLLDANVRTPNQHVAFNRRRENGLSDVIAGSATIASAIKNEVGPGLSLLTAGTTLEGAPHILTESVLQGIVMALTSMFDWVIIDGPPVTVYPETASLAAVAGGAVLVVRAEHTRREVVEESKKVLGESGADVIGAVLNRRKYHIPAFIYRRM